MEQTTRSTSQLGKPASWRGVVDCGLAMGIVGSAVVAGKVLLEGLPVSLAMCLRCAIAAVVLFPLVRWKEGGLPPLGRRSWLLLGGQAVCGVFIFNFFLLWGLTRTDATSAGIITSTTPACMALLAWVFLRERPTRRVLAAVGLAVLGVMVINLTQVRPDAGTGASSLAGTLLVLGAVVGEAVFLLLRKAVREPLSPLALSCILSALGCLIFLPWALPQAWSLDWAQVPAASWWAVIYHALALSIVAYVLWFRGIVRIPAQTAGVLTGIMPLSAMVLSALFLGEAVGLGHIAGCVLVVGALACQAKG